MEPGRSCDEVSSGVRDPKRSVRKIRKENPSWLNHLLEWLHAVDSSCTWRQRKKKTYDPQLPLTGGKYTVGGRAVEMEMEP